MNDWVAHAGSQQLFLSSPVFETLYEGTRGPGKTDALLMDFAQHVGQGYGDYWRGILFRQTYKQLTDVIAKSRRWFKRLFPGAKYNGSDKTWTFPDGEQLILSYMKSVADYDNYHGHEYPWIGWEELTNWPNADCYEAMKSCSRSSNPGMPRKYRATCNPFGVGHNWVKSYFIDPAPRGVVIRGPKGSQRVAIHGHLFENPELMTADPEYVTKLMSITSIPKRRAWLYGDWDITAGGMFDEVWDAETHLVAPFTIPPQWAIDRSFDWGSSSPFSVGWWAEADGTPVKLADGRTHVFPRGTLFRINEWYGWNGEPNVGSRKLATEIAEEVVRREKKWTIFNRCDGGPADPSIWNDVNGNCIARDMSEKYVDWVPANNDRLNGWEIVRIRLANCMVKDPTQEKQQQPEDPGFYVFDRTLSRDPSTEMLGDCEQFKRVFPYAPRDPDNMDDVDTDSEDHIPDEVRYKMLSVVPKVTQVDAFQRRVH